MTNRPVRPQAFRSSGRLLPRAWACTGNEGHCVELIGSPRIGDLNSSMSGDLVSKVGQARAQDGDAAITRELGRTLEVRTCTDRGLYAGHKTVVPPLLEHEQISR
jgi:hypothetical protein